jgi:hypothetical protein
MVLSPIAFLLSTTLLPDVPFVAIALEYSVLEKI